MALVNGIDYGFVTVAPTATPSGSGGAIIDNTTRALKVTSPDGATKITEIGWWCFNDSEESNYEMALYSHNSETNLPNAIISVDRTNAKGTVLGWKRVTVDWSIAAGTVYWLALQLDNTSTITRITYQTDAAERMAYYDPAGQTTLDDTWNDNNNSTMSLAIYALYETAGETVEITGTIAATSTVSGDLSVIEEIEITGTIATVSTVSGNLSISTIVNITGTIACTSGISGTVTVSSNWQTENFAATKRLIVIGNNSLYYESA